ncbi:hypothetical protein AKO1_015285 [Acrasis kona]|uniref:Uncharacterized protein n=1 Tax=Acrasis kona TaxID=1008807 RepID=A0AAW2ZF17_9EUKA
MQSEQTKKAIHLLEKFVEIQSERISIYKLFESSFKEFLSNPHQKTSIINYQRLCQGVTLSFKEVSDNIREVEDDLTKINPAHAHLIRRIQNHEKEKLQNTVKLQKLEQLISQENVRIQKEEESEILLRSHQLECGNDHHHCHHSHEEGQEEVIRGEKRTIYEKEFQEAKTLHVEIIESINECLEEIRYAIEESRELYLEQKEYESENPIVPQTVEEPHNPVQEDGLYL